VDDDHGLAAMPKLVGGPRYSRPPLAVAPRVDRPPDPDDLPLVSEWTPEDAALAAELGLEDPIAAAGFGTARHAEDSGAASNLPDGTWRLGSGTVPEPTSSRRGFGGLLRGRRRRSGAG
jgi:hypothetical protein